MNHVPFKCSVICSAYSDGVEVNRGWKHRAAQQALSPARDKVAPALCAPTPEDQSTVLAPAPALSHNLS